MASAPLATVSIHPAPGTAITNPSTSPNTNLITHCITDRISSHPRQVLRASRV